MRAALTLALVGFWLLPSAQMARAQVDTCVSCHEAEEDEELVIPVPEWRESIHAQHEVSCDACHGGDPRLEDGDESMSEEAGFQETPGWMEMADHCGYCHEEIADTWLDGAFGSQMRAGKLVATCATCHMQDGHRITLASAEHFEISSACPTCPRLEEPERWRETVDDHASTEAFVSGEVQRVEALGLELADFRAVIAETHAAFVREVHAFGLERVARASLAADVRYNALMADLKDLEAQAVFRRRFGVALLGALAVLFGSLLVTQRVGGGA